MKNYFVLEDYERTVVAVINRRIVSDGVWSLESVLRNTTLCHPGNGVNDLRPLSDTLAGVSNIMYLLLFVALVQIYVF